MLDLTDPTRTLPTPWNAGFIGTEWVTQDFTESDIQKVNERSFSTFKRFRSKAYFSVPAGSVVAIC